MYGAARAGFDWDQEYSGTCEKIGMTKIEDTEGSMHRYADEMISLNPVLLACYVDDRVISGPRRLVEMIIEWLSESFSIKITTGNEIKVLGAIFTYIPTGDNRLKVTIRMPNYITALYEDLCKDVGLIKGARLRKSDTPEYDENYDHQTDDSKGGVLGNVSRRYVGRLMYLVRACRLDAFHAVKVLSTEVNDWRLSSDKKLIRVVSYLELTKNRGPNWFFDRGIQKTSKHIYLRGRSDSDHGGCRRTGRSTTGYLTWLLGPGTYAIVDWTSKRQSRVALSTAEAETNATQDAWTRSLLPLAGTLEQVLSNELWVEHQIDADAARAAILKGISLALKYMRKYSRISLAWLHEASKVIELSRIPTDENESDILTKAVAKIILEKHLVTTGWDL